MKNKLVNSFLYFGYNIEKNYRFPFKQSIISENKRVSRSKAEIIQEGSKVLKDVFQDNTINIDKDKTHIVTLSGGLDGRAVLAGLLDQGLQDKVITVSFGTPGTWDYEIPSQVADLLGVKHEGIDLTKINLTTDKLINTILEKPNSKWTFLIDVFYNHLINLRFGKNTVYWSGFDGALADCILSNLDESFKQAKKKFVSKNKRTQKSIAHPDFEPLDVLPKGPHFKPDLLSYSEQLNFGLRQTQLIEPICKHPDYDYRFPLLSMEWSKFMLNLPKKYRQEKAGKKISIYNEILLNTWPDIFEIPTATSWGLPLKSNYIRKLIKRATLSVKSLGRREFPKLPWGKKQSLNYIDFDKGIREREDLKQLVHQNIQDLKKRDVVDWLDIDSIWRQHQERKANLGDTLTLLTSLEINIKAQGELKG